MCILVCVSICVYRCASTCGHMPVEGQRSRKGIFLHCSQPYVLNQSFRNLELTDWPTGCPGSFKGLVLLSTPGVSVIGLAQGL